MSINGIILSGLSAADLLSLEKSLQSSVGSTGHIDVKYITLPTLTQTHTRMLRGDTAATAAVVNSGFTAMDASSAKIGAAFTCNPPADVLSTAMSSFFGGSTATTDPNALSALFGKALFSGNGTAFTTALKASITAGNITSLTSQLSSMSVTDAPSVVVLTDTPTTAPTKAPTTSNTLSTGAIIGIAVGCGGGLIAIIFLLYYFCAMKSSAVAPLHAQSSARVN